MNEIEFDTNKGDAAMNPRQTVVPTSGSRWWTLAVCALALAGLASLPAREALAQAAAKAAAPTAKAAAPAAKAEVPADRQVSDLITRYRFIERYTVGGAAPAPGAESIGQYRVAAKDVLRVVSEKAQGAPDRKEKTVQVIYTEKPAAVSSTGVVTATVRKYESFKTTPPDDAKPSTAKPLEGLTVWFQTRATGSTQLLSLTNNRSLSDTEYVMSTQRMIFLPELATLLPSRPTRLGDHWPLPKTAAHTLLGERMVSGDPLIATLDQRDQAAG